MKNLLFGLFTLTTFLFSSAQTPSVWELLSDPVDDNIERLSDKEDYLSEFKTYRLNLNLLISKLDINQGEFVILDGFLIQLGK